MDILDSHLHVWDPQVLSYDWLQGDLDARFSVEELRTAHGPTWGMRRSIFVEADVRAGLENREVRWISSVAPTLGVEAVVAAVPLLEPQRVADLVRTYSDNALVVGVRQVLQTRKTGAMADNATLESLGMVASAELTFDACVRWDQLPEVAAIAVEIPNLDLVLDHMGKPPLGKDASQPSRSAWASGIAELAANSKVRCKVSGLPAQTSQSWSEESARGLLDEVLAAFGPDRLLYGSDWPVSRQRSAAGRTWDEFVTEWAEDEFDASEREAFWGGNARQFYGLPTGE